MTNSTGPYKRTALVTGANRGLGLEVVRQLLAEDLSVWMSARDPGASREAASRVGARFVALDVTDDESISQAVDRMRNEDCALEVLVNNAGITMDGFDARVVRGTLATNLYGAIAVSDSFVALMSPGSAIVMVSSGMGTLDSFSDELRDRFLDERLTREGLDGLMDEFLESVKNGSHTSEGWPNSAYAVSKAGMNAFTRILAREVADRGIIVNSVSPGWVRTDMGGPGAPRSLEEGGRSIVWAALQSGQDAPTGGFFRDGERIPW